MTYISAGKQKGCLFCRQWGTNDKRGALVLARTPEAIVSLNRFPYANGHLMVAPRRHTKDLFALDEARYGELMEVVRSSAAILSRMFRPQGMNIGINVGRAAGAGIAAHLHWHLVPRWTGDTNFMPMIGEVVVMSEHLEAVYDRLRPHFERLEA
jgi:ATP adenylyltransferase